MHAFKVKHNFNLKLTLSRSKKQFQGQIYTYQGQAHASKAKKTPFQGQGHVFKVNHILLRSNTNKSSPSHILFVPTMSAYNIPASPGLHY